MMAYLQEANVRSAGENRDGSPSREFSMSRRGALNHEGSVISVRERQLLLVRAQAVDAEALNVLFESCRKRFYFSAMRILARPQDDEDAVQQAMLAAYTHLERFQGRADFPTRATRIVTNAALQHIRKTRTKRTVSWDQTDDEFEGASFNKSKNMRTCCLFGRDAFFLAFRLQTGLR